MEPPVLFNSYEFIFLFLPVTLLVFFWIGKRGLSWALGWLGLASLIFYGWWNPRDVPILLASIIINYGFSLALARHRNKAVLAIPIALNLALLLWFKWLVASSQAYIGAFSLGQGLILPLGISFFTFTQIAYLVDVHAGRTRPGLFLDYLLFVSYFPHLIAGPLIYYSQVMPQFRQPRILAIRWDDLALGVTIFSIGLFKKVGLADSVGEYATPFFSAAAHGETLSFFEAWLGALAYSLQLYFDFSGYSDMAIGLSRLFGITLPINFDSPYKATSIIEFWRRWHISLTTFLRNYLFLPLSRLGIGRSSSVLITMLLCGLWHGLGWTFLVFGGLHGLLLIINIAWRRLTRSSGAASHSLWKRSASCLATFIAFTMTLVVFRSEALHGASSILQSMVGLGPRFDEAFPLGLANPTFGVAWVLASLAIVWGAPNTQEIVARITSAYSNLPEGKVRSAMSRPVLLWPAAAGLLLGMAILLLDRPSPFIYFQF